MAQIPPSNSPRPPKGANRGAPHDASLSLKLRTLAPYFAGTQWAFALGTVGAMLAALCESGVTWLMAILVDGNFKALPIARLAELPRPPLWAVPVLLVALFAVRGVAGFVVDYALSWAAHSATMRLRTQLFARVLDATPELFRTRTASSLMNTVVYEVINGVGLLVSSAQTVLKDTFTAIALLGTLLVLNWRLTLFIAALAPAVGYVTRVFGKRMHRITKESQLAIDQLGYVVEENVMAWRMVRLHAAQQAQRERFERSSSGLRRWLMKATVASATLTPVTQLLTAMALAAVIAVALWQRSSGETTIGQFVAFITAALAVATPVRRLTDVSAAVTRGFASVERGLDLIAHAPRESGGTHAVARARGEIAMHDVGLRFDAAGSAPALDGIELAIHAGETIALVGPSGAGKSTLVNLLPRFLDPTSGSVSLDGVALPQWDLHCLREQFALVSQDVVLFNDTVAANVCFGAALDRERVHAALAAANLTEFAAALPQGIDTAIGHNGAQLSGGQRQRMAIARAIYKDAPILILDEATSALDSESERLVQQALETLMKGRTSLVIAHRLSTIERADRIVAIEAGRVIEQGTHQELLAHGGLYARLYALQFRS